MDKEQLNHTLRNLHHELEKIDSIDEETGELLSTLIGDIDQIMNPVDGVALSSEKSVYEQLEEVAVRFEAEHPHLSTVINELMDALNKMGI